MTDDYKLPEIAERVVNQVMQNLDDHIKQFIITCYEHTGLRSDINYTITINTEDLDRIYGPLYHDFDYELWDKLIDEERNEEIYLEGVMGED